MPAVRSSPGFDRGFSLQRLQRFASA